MPPNEAMEYLMGGAGTEFDFELVSLFVRKIIPYPPGTLVRLSNGEIAVVTEVNSNFPCGPWSAASPGEPGPSAARP